MSEEFRSFLSSLGLHPSAIAPDARWRRCTTENKPKKKVGSYKLALDGRRGWGIDFSIHAKPAEWRAGSDYVAPAPFDPAALQRAHAEARRAQVLATQAAREFYTRCEPLRGGHPYLDSHGLDMAGCYGLKIDREGWLVVPAYRERNLMSVQRISADGDKRFWPGAPIKGAAFTIERQNASVTVVCEGVATGLSIYASSGLVRVLAAFHSGNLTEIVPPKSGMLAIAGDNDWKTVCPKHREEGLALPYEPWETRPVWCLCNPGRKAAEGAAKLFGAGFALPPAGIPGVTDFCDWRNHMLDRRFASHDADPFSRLRDSDIRRAVDSEIASAISRAARLPTNTNLYKLERR